MDRILTWVLVAVILAVVAVGLLVVLSSSGAFETWRLQVEADRANAQANQLIAQAELTEEQAELETAKGERVLKESQAQVMTDNSNTVNGLMSFWGIVGSAVIPAAYVVGAVSGGACGLLGGYIIGKRKGLLNGYIVGVRNKVVPVTEEDNSAPGSPFK